MTITVPTSLADITLRQYMALQEVGDDHVKQVSILCNIPEADVKRLTKTTLNEIEAVVGHIKAVDEETYPFVRFVTLNGRKYGFHPNLDEISVGEFVDLEALCANAWGNLPAILAILYRPVTSEAFDLYTVAKYTGNENPDPMYTMTMDVVLGALNFFLSLGVGFVTSSRSSLMEEVAKGDG